MGEVLNSWQVYFPCYCKNSNIGRGQIEVLTFYWFFETKEKASDCFLFKVYAKSILMRRQIIAFREKRRFMRRNCSRRNHFLNSWLMRKNPLMTRNSVTRGGWAKSWYILHHHQGFFSWVCERARVLFERAIKSYFVDTLTENQICHPIPAALSENWAFRVFISMEFRMLLPLQYLCLYCESNTQWRRYMIMFYIFFNNMVH